MTGDWELTSIIDTPARPASTLACYVTVVTHSHHNGVSPVACTILKKGRHSCGALLGVKVWTWCVQPECLGYDANNITPLNISQFDFDPRFLSFCRSVFRIKSVER
ncbi:hypothetical protein AG1IA_05037 [Rhizoctonia solani AG-1 IA]|uniref:Uncharacterized protein n=1 Tax=Thanatephorus cucumeris (strain AG1-IA) TaxID=983506 RepID=L8WVV1_THACA|nr:hypothetical protein AG1IA_05037 [Rhizoctonia solani AG-1 IA]